jgi:cysteine synthase
MSALVEAETLVGGQWPPDTGVLSAVGKTSLVRLDRVLPGVGFALYAKLEMLNPGGSIKDRDGRFMKSGDLLLLRGDEIAELFRGQEAAIIEAVGARSGAAIWCKSGKGFYDYKLEPR